MVPLIRAVRAAEADGRRPFADAEQIVRSRRADRAGSRTPATIRAAIHQVLNSISLAAGVDGRLRHLRYLE